MRALRAECESPFAPYDPDKRRRLAAEHPDLQLTAAERAAIGEALVGSPRLLAGFARRTLKRWDDLWPHQRVEALDLFADVVHNRYFRERPLSIPLPQEITR